MISFVICGVEHSGTTMVSDLFRQVSSIDAGVEVGVLLNRTPRQFLFATPFAANMLGGWNITAAELACCCDTDSFSRFYDRLRSFSRDLKPGTSTIFDKTPRYLAQLETCLAKVPVPFILTYKDPRSIVFSDFTRSGEADFDRWFDGYAEAKLGYLRLLYMNYRSRAARGRRVLRVGLETLCLNPRTMCEAMFAHCRQAFLLRYLLFAELRYRQTRSTSISPRIPFEYMNGLSVGQQRLVVRAFAEFGEWFYD